MTDILTSAWISLRGLNGILIKKEILNADDYAIVILLFDHRGPHNTECDFDFTIQLYEPKENRNWKYDSVQGSYIKAYKILSDNEFNVDKIKKFISENHKSITCNFRQTLDDYFNMEGQLL